MHGLSRPFTAVWLQLLQSNCMAHNHKPSLGADICHELGGWKQWLLHAYGCKVGCCQEVRHWHCQIKHSQSIMQGEALGNGDPMHAVAQKLASDNTVWNSFWPAHIFHLTTWGSSNSSRSQIMSMQSKKRSATQSQGILAPGAAAR